MKKKGIIILLICLVCSLPTFAQGRKALRINEVMVQNDSNYVDEYGAKSAWIELYNSNHNTLKIASVYLTNDKSNPRMYAVPRGDVKTDIPSLQHVVFFADGDANKGTFHVNFKLEPGVDNWIGLYDADGKTLIDEVVVPATLPANDSYALKADGVSSADGKFDSQYWEVRDGSNSKYITPSSNNIIIDSNESIEKFEQNDPDGFVLTIMAMGIVFSALVLLSLCFLAFGKINEKAAKKNKAIAHAGTTAEEIHPSTISGDSGEEIAAISMALYEHLNAHDVEETVLTINKVRRAYSPWSSKIYTLTRDPRQ